MAAEISELGADAGLANAMMARVLVESYSGFSAFLEQQVGSRAVSVEILQDAFVRGMHKLDTVYSNESTVDWFYRLLRSSVIDQPKYSGSFDHKLTAFRVEIEQNPSASGALARAIHDCIGGLAATLDQEQAIIVRSIELEGIGIGAFAEQAGIAAAVAEARLSLARAALRRQVVSACGTCTVHGVWNCNCGSGIAGYGHVKTTRSD
jgi:DNA-directed RNA polymerase specialized sigma24 family protein